MPVLESHVPPASASATGKHLHTTSQGIPLCPSDPHLQPFSVLSGAENPFILIDFVALPCDVLGTNTGMGTRLVV